MPVAPMGPFSRGVSRVDNLHIEGGPHGGKLEGLPVLGLAVNVLFPESIAHSLVHAAFQLAFEALRIDHHAGIHGRGHFQHPHVAGFGVDLQLHHLDVENVGHVSIALASLRVEGEVAGIFLDPVVPRRLAGLLQSGIGVGSGFLDRPAATARRHRRERPQP